jgi:AraC-like DNA-binding protein
MVLSGALAARTASTRCPFIVSCSPLKCTGARWRHFPARSFKAHVCASCSLVGESSRLRRRLHARQRQDRGREPVSQDLDRRDLRVQLGDFVGCEPNVCRTTVLEHVRHLGRAGDGNDPRLLRHQPGHCDLGRSGFLPFGPSAHYLLTVMSLPVVMQIAEASIDRPYLGLALDLDPSIVSSVMVETGLPASRASISARAVDVSQLEGNLLDAVVRLVRLMDSPIEARVMQPLVTREIVYRLLVGAQGDRLRHLTQLGGGTTRIASAIERLGTDFDKPLRIERIANDLGMSVSGFHAQFKAVTAMSPLQFQKHIRLQEARRLMIANDLDAASAGHRVGYEDASHFTREYKRLFGEPPIRDMQRVRTAATTAADL